MRQAQALIDVARAPAFLARPNAARPPTRRSGSPPAGSSISGAASGAASRRARPPREASADDLAGATLSLQAQVAQNYFLLRVQDAQIRLLQDSVTRYERSLQLTRNQYAVGRRLARRRRAGRSAAQVDPGAGVRGRAEPGAARACHRDPDRQAAGGFQHRRDDRRPARPGGAARRCPPSCSSGGPTLPRRSAGWPRPMRRSAWPQAAFYPSARLFAGGGIDISFAGGIALAQFLLDGGLRDAQKAQATAAYDETIANYRQTVLTALARRRGQSRRAAHPRRRSCRARPRP